MKRRITKRAALGAAVLLAVGAAVVAATGFESTGGDAETRDKLPPATAKVARKTLVDTRTESGELGYDNERTLNARLAGTVTALPAVGSTIGRGKALYYVDNTPVVLMYGGLPSYRVLSPGVEGRDVEQFEKNLWALGYRGFTVDDEYTSATASAVEDWQEDLGLEETGTVEEGRVVYASGPVRVHTREASVGDAVQPGKDVLTYTGKVRVATVELTPDDQRLARKGSKVSVELPNGERIPGKITKVETVVKAAASEREDPETKLEVTIALTDEKALSGLGQATVDVAFTASRREDVLTVPVAALLALAEGGYGVEAVEGVATRVLPVETGLFADGFVEVSGDGLKEGMTVGMPS